VSLFLLYIFLGIVLLELEISGNILILMEKKNFPGYEIETFDKIRYFI